MAPAASSAAKKGSSLKLLTTKLKDVQSSFNDIWQFVENFTEEATITEAEIRLQKLDELWERFGDILVEIKSHDDYPADGDGYEKERKEFSDYYYRAKSFLLDRVKERQEHSSLEQSIRVGDTTMQGTLDHVRLPQIKLQSFNGDIDEWLSFRDLFTSLIHWKSDLPEVEKFHYLKGCLQGEPKSLIDPLQITKANYLIAWDMLLKRYNNSKLLKKRQVESLFKLPSLSKESASELHILLEGFERVIQTLDQTVQPGDYKDLLLINLLTVRLDPVTRRGWEECSASKEMDTLKDLIEFLHRRVQVLESIPPRSMDNRGIHQSQASSKQKPPNVKTSYSTAQSSGGRCVACAANHLLYQCGSFQRMLVAERDALLRTHSLCRNCFRQGHQARDCQSKFSCRNCKGRHHTMVCFKREKDSNGKGSIVATDGNSTTAKEPQASSTQGANLAATDVSASNPAQQFSSQVLLATAVIIVEDDDGRHIPARALLDSGSESNFITERLSQRLKVKRQRVDISVLGIGQAGTKVKQRILTTIRSRVSDFSREMSFLVLPKVTVNLPTATINATGWAIPNGVQLADPSFCVSKGVDIVLGIEAFFDFFVTGQKISLGEQMPALNESVFGWVVCGGLSAPNQSLQINCNLSMSDSLDALLTRFWDCEEIESVVNYSPEEVRCEALFAQTVQRGTYGRYTVSLPKDEEILARMGDSRDIVFRRLLGTERRLARNADLKEQYVSFMDEYCRLGHMKRVDINPHDTIKRCYLPHHPVVKEASTTTKVRVVFGASCKTSSGISLNDVLLVGPVIQEDLRSIIMRCRTKQIMIVADVEKMFRQIDVKQEERPLQCILWRPSPADDVATYELNTVTYGTKPAPFLATRTLKQLALDEEIRFPLAAQAAIKDTYMDDVLTGSDNVEEAIKLRIQLDEMMSSGGFRLRKWASNAVPVLAGIAEENLAIRDADGINLDPDPSVKTLGLTWLPNTDVFRFQFNIPTPDTVDGFSKRRILSMIATLFDPLGLIGATITTAKLFMQLLWTLRDEDGNRLDWDQPIPPTVGENWRKFHLQLPLLNEIRINRSVILPGAVAIELHCFSDASEKAYGACIYIRSQDAEGKVAVRLLASKSRVAPLKCQTIPRLELCGALIAAQLYEKVQQSVRINSPVFFWTDSTCVLRWIKAVPSTWITFIANRVAKIQNLTEHGEWRHVPGIHNPADLISRGISPQDIINNESWWNGPSWLAEARDQWPQYPGDLNSEEEEEERRRTVIAAPASSVTEFNDWYIGKFSSYSEMVRRTAIWLRLMKLLRTPKEDRRSGFLTSIELREAECVLVRRVQLETFSKEWKSLSKGEPVPGQSSLRWYNPIIAEDRLIRLGGRLRHSKESEETKHPMALPARHRFTRMLMQHYHERLLHAGPQLLLSVVKLRFWPLRGRDMARQIVHKCQRCFRSKPTPVKQFMGELPEARVTVSRPFSKTGVDYFGPIYLRPVPRRAAVKAYVAIFICLCTKAVHMELVSDLSTDRFLQALRRFVARRGRCTDLYSDNGTNFVGARNKLLEFLELQNSKQHRDKVSKFCADKGMRWHFSPPSAPHFGGLWEAAVRSAKHHILRVLGNNPVTPEDMNTLLIQVEGCLNSRPITALSTDPNDLEPLTPAHFLVGTSLQSIPEPEYEDIQTNRLNRWQLMQRNLQDFWTRWRREYLSQLQSRIKRWRPPIQVEVGKLVIIQDDNQPPLRWKMGRIHAIHPGDDGVVRVVTLKTATGMLTRPVEKICILPAAEFVDDAESGDHQD
ncbi:uncharacterized protein LOC131694586 [Topomyia yanbarensis]|uniref:uncharacterized protein LOC131694586 n=1 Tax=Topomyia yanbarensis TaxID=2498891 RepID=UPI00273B085C|nr:uncharacterized protein LOC131694586 [Topomyia yanbarensis]